MRKKYRGIIYIVLSAFCFAFMNMFVRMAGDLPSVQKSFFRNFVAAIFAGAVLIKEGSPLKCKKENLIYRTDDVNIVLYDYYGYNNFFDYNKMNTILENLYLDIELENGIQTIKLSVDKYFSNDKIKYDKENEVIKTPNQI